jgi:hypothetical protein
MHLRECPDKHQHQRTSQADNREPEGSEKLEDGVKHFQGSVDSTNLIKTGFFGNDRFRASHLEEPSHARLRKQNSADATAVRFIRYVH